MSREFIRRDKGWRHRIFGVKQASRKSIMLRKAASEIAADVIRAYKEKYKDRGAKVSATVVGSVATGTAVEKRRNFPDPSDLDTFYFISNSRFKKPNEEHRSGVFHTLDNEHRISAQKAGISGHITNVIYLDHLLSELRIRDMLTDSSVKQSVVKRRVVNAIVALFFPAVKGSLLPERKKLLLALKQNPDGEAFWHEIQAEWQARVIHSMRGKRRKAHKRRSLPKEEIKLMDFNEICKLYGVRVQRFTGTEVSQALYKP